MTTESPRLDELPAVIQFLLGEAPLDGVWFGGKPPAAGQFWWREQLRQCIEASRAVRAEPVGYPPELSSHQRTRPAGSQPRFSVQDGGDWIDDDDFIFDAMLKISGDFGAGMRLKYAQMICDLLNAPERATHQPQASESVPAVRFQVHVAGPDDLHSFDDELSALRLANDINRIYLADRLKHPDDEVLCVATVSAASLAKTASHT